MPTADVRDVVRVESPRWPCSKGTMGNMDPNCNRCGTGEPTWLVTMRYIPNGRAGRLLAYCDRCREDRAEHVYVAIPYEIVRQAPDLVLGTLYEQQLTESEPHTAADVIGIAPGVWTTQAEGLLRAPKVD